MASVKSKKISQIMSQITCFKQLCNRSKSQSLGIPSLDRRLSEDRGGKTTKVPDFRAAITVTTLTMNENAFSLPKTLDFTPRTEPLKFCRFRPILAIFSESVK